MFVEYDLTKFMCIVMMHFERVSKSVFVFCLFAFFFVLHHSYSRWIRLCCFRFRSRFRYNYRLAWAFVRRYVYADIRYSFLQYALYLGRFLQCYVSYRKSMFT